MHNASHQRRGFAASDCMRLLEANFNLVNFPSTFIFHSDFLFFRRSRLISTHIFLRIFQ